MTSICARRGVLATLAALGLLITACGSDKSSSDTTSGANSSAVAPAASSPAESTPAASSPAESAPAGGSSTTPEAPNPTGPQDLVVGRANAILGFNADYCIGIPTLQTLPMVYGTLLDWTPDGQHLTPGLAESVTLDPAEPSYTIKLRQGLQFSDGSALTSADVVFSVSQWKAGELNGGFFTDIASVTAPDDLTVVLHLSAANTYIEDLLSWCVTAVYPENFGGKTAEQFFEAPIGAGPFTLESWKNPGPSEEIKLAKNPTFWRADDVLLDSVTFVANTDPNQRLLAYQAGQLDVLEQVEFESVSSLPSDEILTTPNHPIQLLLVNTAKPGLDDIKVRQAISLAIDRDKLTLLFDGLAEPAKGVLPANTPFGKDPSQPFHFDLDAAKKLMAESKSSKGLDLELLTDPSRTALAQVISDQLKAIGVNLTITTVDNGTLFSRGGDGSYDLQLNGNVATSPTALDPLIATKVINWYYTGMDQSVAADEIAQALASNDDAERTNLMGQVQDKLVEQATQIGLVTTAPVYAVKPKVHGFAPFTYLRWYPEQVWIG